MKRFLSVLLALLLLALPVKTAAVTDLSANYTDTSFEVVSDDNISRAASANPVGNVERVNHLGVAGWAWMSSSPNTPINVHIYITNSNGFKRIYGTTANIYRTDLYNAGYGNGCHGFSYDIDWRTIPPGTYNVTVYGIGGNNPAITNPYSTYTVRYCAGVVEAVTSDSIAGWAWKPDEPNSSINVHLYVKRSNGEQVDLIGEVAYIYRSDLYNAGYGDGCHGFDIEMDWSQYPEERLSLYLYFVDGSGYHNCFWTGYYDNTPKPANLLGMVDDEGRKFYTAFADPMTTWCENMGCTEVNIFNGGNASDIISSVYTSYYSTIFTHGSPTSLYWRLNNSTGSVTTTDISNLFGDYFDSTKCLLIMACQAGSGGSGGNNVVNAFYNKGVDTVIGFQENVTFYYYSESSSDNYLNLVLDKGASLWMRTFVQTLSNGATVQAASDTALNSVKDKHGTENTQGLDSVYIAGNANMVLKR